MTPQDTEALKALVALAKKAGAHEWAIDGDDRPGMEWNNFIVQADARHMTVCFMAHAEGDNSELEAAAEFIAAAKNAIPALERMLASQVEPQAHPAPVSKEPGEAVIEILRSAYSIAQRGGKDTNWEAFRERTHEALKAYFEQQKPGAIVSAPLPEARGAGDETVDAEAAAREITESYCEYESAHDKNKISAHIAAIIRRHTHAPGEGWQPIETAPKDGTHFIGCSLTGPVFGWNKFGARLPAMAVAHWWDGDKGKDAGFYDSASYYDENPPLQLTHWQPLPAAPSQEDI